ncbi:uncharacterized protein LOC106865766 isoform X2 [Brachypodium distachyon]|uniref:Uncharacterized protein n=2 Tax=Brachypodium distachyon TaxID=15368 RepID=I1GUP6_BRADI|nr:uncharacterized protein LOC106865766 isoform X2 [Brachypodium distachyon]KQK16379.1 hypothetical protein BRADI_1g28480v3 [Brachypodium distachyon]|eukprot:XP_024310395.1 uncharacterized protein LOC106865766 isoform X2 [Brachypodium distachyon]
MAGEEKKAAEDYDGKSQQPVGRTAATATARDSSVNASLPGGTHTPMASFQRLAAAGCSSMNYNVQQSVTNAIHGHGHGQTGHQHGDTLRSAAPRTLNLLDRVCQSTSVDVDSPFGYRQPPSAGLPLLPSYQSTGAPRTLNLLDRLGQSTSVDVLAPLMCLACKTMPMRTLSDPSTMHHCICEYCFRAGIACPNCCRDINLDQSSLSAQEKSSLPRFEPSIQRLGLSSRRPHFRRCSPKLTRLLLRCHRSLTFSPQKWRCRKP